jgi:hypothetical protein
MDDNPFSKAITIVVILWAVGALERESSKR